MILSSNLQHAYNVLTIKSQHSTFTQKPTAMEPDFQLFSSLRYDPLLLSLPRNTNLSPSSDVPSSPSPFYMLPYHRDRILSATNHFKWTTAASLISGPSGLSHLQEKLSTAVNITSPEPTYIKILLSHSGEITFETRLIPSTSESNLFPGRLPPPESVPKKKMEVSPLTGGAMALGGNTSFPSDPSSAPDDIYEVIPDTESTKVSAYTSFKTTNRGMYTGARERAGISRLDEKKEVLIVNEDGEVMEGSLTTVYLWREGKWVTPVLASGGQDGTTRRWALERKLCVEAVIKSEELKEGEDCWISNGVRGFLKGRVRLS